AEAALTVSEHDLGWVVEPGHPELLAQTIRLAARREDSARAERAAVTAHQFNFAAAMAGYSGLIARLLRQR
ncbi:MAG: glycosyltransferase family 4 protein, partial [Bradyrhizobium sp.]